MLARNSSAHATARCSCAVLCDSDRVRKRVYLCIVSHNGVVVTLALVAFAYSGRQWAHIRVASHRSGMHSVFGYAPVMVRITGVFHVLYAVLHTFVASVFAQRVILWLGPCQA